jgi:hypothetical protein
LLISKIYPFHNVHILQQIIVCMINAHNVICQFCSLKKFLKLPFKQYLLVPTSAIQWELGPLSKWILSPSLRMVINHIHFAYEVRLSSATWPWSCCPLPSSFGGCKQLRQFYSMTGIMTLAILEAYLSGCISKKHI